jgi:hypothetical protein
MAGMKSENVSNANVSFYDILTKGINLSQLALRWWPCGQLRLWLTNHLLYIRVRRIIFILATEALVYSYPSPPSCSGHGG